MAYQIHYQDTMVIKKVPVVRKPAIKWLLAICAILIGVGLLQLKTVQDFLIPGEPEVTKAAFAAFTKDLEEGEPFGDAAAAFCRQVIQNDIGEQ